MKQLYGVIGDPINHSMSPAMHNSAFSALGMDAYYHPFHVRPSELTDAIKGLKALNIKGFNVTVPHKTTIIPLLDEIDPLAAAIGAVNTVVNRDGKLVGFNTDGLGFVSALLHEMGNLINPECKVLIVGSGGAARAIYYTLLSEGWNRVDICNRTIQRAWDLIKECPIEGKSIALDMLEAQENLDKYDLIIQTTSIGMSPLTNESPIDLEKLKSNSVVCDIIYNPLETEFLTKASQKGSKTQNGIGMFVYQGALAFELWTGMKPDSERMKKVVLQQLGGTTC
ncbi:shikimate dehydrogenase [Peribacillus alkalitolerans]|uniref:shikimate dehydrogenase n=1 Tax=Peribacillus alkalitolerans TaxID=1550385 RepID=UPI0013D38501|nr:shikimate dehydrogenase [Peribacillus alkalitolerans]